MKTEGSWVFGSGGLAIGTHPSSSGIFVFLFVFILFKRYLGEVLCLVLNLSSCLCSRRRAFLDLCLLWRRRYGVGEALVSVCLRKDEEE